MPVNKNAQFRYQVLDRCFSDFYHKYDFDTLLEKVNDHLKDVEYILMPSHIMIKNAIIAILRKTFPSFRMSSRQTKFRNFVLLLRC